MIIFIYWISYGDSVYIYIYTDYLLYIYIYISNTSPESTSELAPKKAERWNVLDFFRRGPQHWGVIQYMVV